MAAAKKKAVKKKAANKKTVKKKTAAKKKIAGDFFLDPKLGHDPLAWMSGDEESIVSSKSIVVEPELQPDIEEVSNEVVKSVSDTPAIEVLDTDQQETAGLEVIADQNSEETSNNKEETMLNLPDVFGIAQAEVMYEAFDKQLTSAEEIQIDASAVEVVDASALQLLILLFNECKSQGKKVSWHAQSDKINESAKLLNLTGSLGL